ncbi:MAG: hypothetical protein OXQ94_00700 [Gemmatimonadota bacterium]|nr:hypothetical protein [Gemmatimonadota bacterium]MDE2870198.1 hypothetical protein [Gemmatimonadota bacterium]
MATAHNNLPVRVTPWVTLRDFVVFQLKLVLEAFKDVVAINLSVLAMATDLIVGRWRNPRLFHGVVRLSRRFDGWLGLHRLRGATLNEENGSFLEKLIAEAPDADELADEFERLVRKRMVRQGSR